MIRFNDELLEKVGGDVEKVLEEMSEYTGIGYSRSQKPNVDICPRRTSAYLQRENTIYINRDQVDKGHVYSEEVSHYLRGLRQLEENEVLYGNDDPVVQEFYGAIGRIIGKELLEEKPGLEHLEWPDELFGTEKEWEIYEKSMEESEKNLRGIRKEVERNREEIGRLQRDHYRKTRELIDQGFENRKKWEQIHRELKDLREQFVGELEDSNEELPEGDTKILRDFVEELYDHPMENIEKIGGKTGENFNMERYYREQRNEETRGLLADRLVEQKIISDNSVTGKIELMEQRNRARKKEIRIHREAYMAAKKFTFEELDEIKDLYRLENHEVKTELLKNPDMKDRFRNGFTKMKKKLNNL